MTITNIVFYFALTLGSILIFKTSRKRIIRGGLPLPPGPIGLPVIGNVFGINIVAPWLTYEEWAKRYGDIVYANLLGQDCIIINSERVAQALLEQRSSVYSDRPYIATNKLFGMDFNTGLLPYGPQWRLHRKMFHMALSKESAMAYKSMQLEKVYQLIQNLLSTPQDYPLHLYTCSSAIIMAITYGYDVVPQNDRFVSKVLRSMSLFLEALTPERAALHGAFPVLAHIPSWLPGGRYKLRAGECCSLVQDMLNDPVDYVKGCMATETAKKSLVYGLLRDAIGNNLGYDEDTVKAVATTAFLGGAETSFATFIVFILAMVLYPEVQTKAQEEIDRVVGTNRLPDFQDRTSLPYVEAVYLETLRWKPVSPMGLPHMTTTSDVYEGMYIPKNALVFVNMWAISQDERRYPEPRIFNPERFMTPSGDLSTEVPVYHAFGFGRRYCPGKYVSAQSVWALIVSILATLRIEKAKDDMGNEIEFIPEFTGGLSSHPKPFPCSFKSRSKNAEQLIYARKDKE
ncbi:cytochrome P450 [Scleroderma yunnanense]